MQGMTDFAKHIIGRAQDAEKKLTNLHLQKIMYFTFVKALENSLIAEDVLRTWYDQPFTLWRYGAYVESIYTRYSVYGVSNIFTPEKQDERFCSLNPLIDDLLDEKPLDLVFQELKSPFYQKNAQYFINGKSDIRFTFEDLHSRSIH